MPAAAPHQPLPCDRNLPPAVTRRLVALYEALPLHAMWSRLPHHLQDTYPQLYVP
jgi:hypothetical protein